MRRDGREPGDLRPIAFTRDYTEFAAGSVLVEFGRTRVLNDDPAVFAALADHVLEVCPR